MEGGQCGPFQVPLWNLCAQTEKYHRRKTSSQSGPQFRPLCILHAGLEC